MPPKPLAFLGEFWRPLYDLMVTSRDCRATCGGLARIVFIDVFGIMGQHRHRFFQL